MGAAVSEKRFREMVADALDSLPDEWARLLDNVAVVVAEEPTREELAVVGMSCDDEGELFGLYSGTPQSERGFEYAALPDRIVIYRGPILRACTSRRQVVRQILETVYHELGHHFGLDEGDLPF